MVLAAVPCEAWTQEVPDHLQTSQLVAWCLVPFDASQRGPQERAEMLKSMGFGRFAYDWRDEHIPSWDEELEQLRRQDVELTAFWCVSSLHPARDAKNQQILELLKRHQTSTQLWIMLPDNQLAAIQDEGERVRRAAQAIREFADAARPLGCQVGLYNHGGWIGKPATLVKVMQELEDLDNVGIVYNFHHAHEDLSEFPDALMRMQPYLLCLNLNGTTPGGPKIQTLGEGKLDAQILQWIRDAEYSGPIGILDHRPDMDARKSLQLNLDGLARLLPARR